MPFQSILFEQPDMYAGPDIDAGPGEYAGPDTKKAPQFFADLNLDQVMASMTSGRDEYHLAPYFLPALRTASAVDYRHQILHDLEEEDVRAAVDGYARGLSRMRGCLAAADRLRDTYQRERWFLDAADIYCQSTRSFAEQITGLELSRYAQSGEFTRLAAETRTLLGRLAAVRYAVSIKGNRVTVSTYQGEEDYGADVEKTFAKFKQGAVKDYRSASARRRT